MKMGKIASKRQSIKEDMQCSDVVKSSLSGCHHLGSRVFLQLHHSLGVQCHLVTHVRP